MLLQGMATDFNGFGLFELGLKSVWKTISGPELAMSAYFCCSWVHCYQTGTSGSEWFHS